jgi:nicotinate-nucleotide adenylyltransferase
MRIAFFGGTFDPPHRGHVAIANAAADRLALDRVLVAPVGRQPLKDGSSLASYDDRLAMVELAFAEDSRPGHSTFEASRLDAPRPDGQYNYTYETLAQLKSQLHPHSQLFCLLGADSFHTLAHWHRAAELVLLANFIIATRPGYALQELGSRLPDGVKVLSEIRQPGTVEVQLARTSTPDLHSTLYVMTDLKENISATALRQALASGDTAAFGEMLTPGVTDYICKHHLYDADLQC